MYCENFRRMRLGPHPMITFIGSWPLETEDACGGAQIGNSIYAEQITARSEKEWLIHGVRARRILRKEIPTRTSPLDAPSIY